MWMLKISYTDHITNEEVLRRTNSKRALQELILKKKLEYFGLVVLVEKLRRHLMDWRVKGERWRGRPRRTDITEATNQSYCQCVKKVQRRERLQHISDGMVMRMVIVPLSGNLWHTVCIFAFVKIMNIRYIYSNLSIPISCLSRLLEWLHSAEKFQLFGLG